MVLGFFSMAIQESEQSTKRWGERGYPGGRDAAHRGPDRQRELATVLN